MKKKILERVIELAEAEDISVSVDDGWISFRFYTSAGQDVNVDIPLVDTQGELADKLWEYAIGYDPSEEASLWLDESGHGKNGAPYDMIDVYNDMVEAKKTIERLESVIRNDCKRQKSIEQGEVAALSREEFNEISKILEPENAYIYLEHPDIILGFDSAYIYLEHPEIVLGFDSPKWQDANVKLKNTTSLQEFIDELSEYTESYDPSAEAYKWLDETGHGKNGAPHDMGEIYNDMLWVKQKLEKMLSLLKDNANGKD
jgi:hypothetical protein